MISDQSHGFFQSVSDWLLCICYLVHTQTADHVVVLSSCLSVINPHDILQKCVGGVDQQRWKFSQETKVIMLSVKFKLNLNRVTEEIADFGDVDTIAFKIL